MKKKNSNYERFVLHLEEWDKTGVPYGLSDLIDLAVKYNTPLPVKQLEGVYSKEQIEEFNKKRGVTNYEA